MTDDIDERMNRIKDLVIRLQKVVEGEDSAVAGAALADLAARNVASFPLEMQEKVFTAYTNLQLRLIGRHITETYLEVTITPEAGKEVDPQMREMASRIRNAAEQAKNAPDPMASMLKAMEGMGLRRLTPEEAEEIKFGEVPSDPRRHH